MTVIDAVKLALERVAPSHLAAAVVGSRVAERAAERRAEELLALMGLRASRESRHADP